MSKKNKTKRKKRIFNKYHSINRIKRKKSRRQYSYKPLKRKSKDRNIKNNLNTVSLIVEEKVIETNIQSQKSKGDEKREKIFEIFKNHLNFLNDKGFVSTDKDIYLCPLDLKPHHNVYEDDPLTLEDAPPKSLGGKAHVLTCKSCNNKRGQDIDAELAKFLKEAKNINVAFNRLKAGKSINNLHLPKSDHEVVLEINGKYIDGKMGFEKEGKMSVVLPIELAPDTVLNFVGSKVPKWAQYSLLKAAYMLLFKKTGYTLLLEKCCDVVRKQIEKPDENIYPDNFCRITSKDNVLTKDNKEVKQGVYFVQDKGLESILVVFDVKLGDWEKKILVFLPLPVRDLNSALSNLKEKLEKGKGQSLELYPQEQDREHAGDYLMKEDNLEAMYNWIELRKKEA